MKDVISVDADCHITYSDGTTKLCPYCPPYTFSECEIGYGSERGCAKWDYYHKER